MGADYMLTVVSAVTARTLLSDNRSPYNNIQCWSAAIANCAESTFEVIPANGKLHTLDVSGPI